MPWMLALKLFAGNALGKLWSWLCHRSFWQLASLALAAVCLLLIYQRNDARHDRDSYKTQRDYYVGELKRITSARDEQRKTSERTVREVVEGQEKVRTVVKTIHDAPNPEGCRTPALDELRRVL